MLNLAYVLTFALAVFVLAKPVCLSFMPETDFTRRRNVWLVLTTAGFLTPNIWVFAALAFPILLWSGSKDSNPIALYLMVFHVVPPFGVQIPTIVINQLFELNMYRILAFALLLPAAWRLLRARRSPRDSDAMRLMDHLLLAYGGLVLLSGMPYETITNSIRRLFLFGIDVLLLYYVASRVCTDRRRIVDAMATFVLVCAIAAPMAVIEALRNTQFYSAIGYKWHIDYMEFAKLLRGETLRAQVFAGHALALGYLMAMGFGFWLCLNAQLRETKLGLPIAAWLWLGLVATLSRGPWLVAVAAFLVFMAAGPHGSVRLIKGLFIFGLVTGLVLASPIGDAFLDILPFIGSVDDFNVVYRQRLAEVSWTLILENPLFGDPFFLRNMEELRQGQGIIDLVNVYAAVALQSGLVGLALFLGPFVVGIRRAYSAIRRTVITDPDFANLGAGLIACMAGTLLMFATGSFGTGLQVMFYLLTGLVAAYAQAGHAIALVRAEGTTNPQRWPDHGSTSRDRSRTRKPAHV